MSAHCETSGLPLAPSPGVNWLNTVRKQWKSFNEFRRKRAIVRHAPPLDNHLRRDIGLPGDGPQPDRLVVDWKDPLGVEIRRVW